MENKVLFTDNELSRSLLSDSFNFVLDKESGVSLCWGKNINESPEYDPTFPQQIAFKIDSTFNLNKMLQTFNFLANIKIKQENKDAEDNKESFVSITDEIEALTNENTVCLSTLGCVYLIFDNSIKNINIDNVLKFINYIKKFKVAFHIQMNIDTEFSMTEYFKIKLLSTKLMLRTECTNSQALLNNLKQLENQDITVGLELIVTKNNINTIFDLAEKLTNKNISITFYFVEPYISTSEYVKVQKTFVEKEFTAIQLATCNHNRFNKRKPNIHINVIDCDASRFSIYVENNEIYPCQFKTTNSISLNKCKSISDFWQSKTLNKFRKYIIENNFCKLINKK